MVKSVNIGRIKFGAGSPMVLIAGPCVIESRALCLETAKRIKELSAKVGIPYIFKASFDKANRLSLESFRGPGIKKGLEILAEVKEKLKIPVLSDIHCQKDIPEAAGVLDIIQIPAFLCRQTDILLAAAGTGKPINIKKGQFLAPADILPLIKKVESAGNKSILITERGFCFGYNNLVSDLRSLEIMRGFGYPVIYDATHSVQLPGGGGCSSGGERQFIPGLSRAAAAFGCDGLFLEVHPHPEKALCDGPNTLGIKALERLLRQVKKIERALR